MLNEEYIIELIIESRENRLDPIKKSILEDWSNENPVLREKLDKAMNEMDDLTYLKFIKNRKPDWDTIIFRSRKRRVFDFVKIGSRYAAVIAILVSIVIFIQKGDNLNLSSITSKNKAINKNEVVILFSDGSTQLAVREEYNLEKNYILTKESLTISSANGRDAYPVSVYTPANKNYKVILPDGSLVWLNTNSYINFASVGKRFNRDVTIDGECFFEVSKSVDKPFTVKSNLSKITVLGTKFNVNDRSGEDASITLETGSLMVECGNQSNKISPGEQLNFSDESNTITIKEVEANLYSLWKEGYFVFENISLKDILTKLEEWYGTEYLIEDYNLQNRKMFAIVKRYQSPDSVLTKLSGTGNFSFKIVENKIQIFSTTNQK